MTNLLWPGDHRAGDLMTDEALLRAMVRVESAWLTTLAGSALIPSDAISADLDELIGSADCAPLAIAAEDGGNAVIELVALLRARAPASVSPWIHRGLTSQDVIDTALMLTIRQVLGQLKSELARHVRALEALARTHRHTSMVARTLTQHAVPTTFGAKTATWLTGVCDAVEGLGALSTPVQIGGAAGTLGASTELAGLRHPQQDPAQTSIHLIEATAEALGLQMRLPWHTSRFPLTALADAMVTCSDAWGHIASDIVTLARPEIGELSEPIAPQRGRSSTLPDKRNPVLSILIRRAAITAPPLAATLHTAAALAHDERPDGAWHAEWDTARTLARRTVVAGSQCTEVLAGLQVHTDRMSANLAAADVYGEQRAIAELTGKPSGPSYFGAADAIVDAAVDRAQRVVKDNS
jgi:3-carboxy-cis,cis-muconate cycloisomerase